MKLFVAKETDPQETRAPIIPRDLAELAEAGAQVEVEQGIGLSIDIADSDYEQAGARISTDRQASLAVAEMVLSISVPPVEDIHCFAEGAIYVGCMAPFENAEIVNECAACRISAISLEMIPRTTIAQKMDVLSSQANLGGYVAVILAAERHNAIFPMMTTPAGTIRPIRVFVIGAGVAGLQAIATAKRLGARVDAFDVRPEAQEEILSLGAKPLKIDIGPTEQTKDGYVKELSQEQLQIQQQAMAKQCAISEVVITTARVFGKKAPLIVTNEMLDAVKPGSVVVDLAVEAGGNVEASELGKEIERNGVTIIGIPELQRRVPLSASQMFSGNLCNFVTHFWDADTKQFVLDRRDEIIKACLITHEGKIVNPTIEAAVKQGNRT
ncbi:MAG: NAD(P) transhydrogenase subunit alpha [Planctomycetota bacterium]|jgi:NAD(P) transhydrogenase subunit alpha